MKTAIKKTSHIRLTFVVLVFTLQRLLYPFIVGLGAGVAVSVGDGDALGDFLGFGVFSGVGVGVA